jgi:hypothetical protein
VSGVTFLYQMSVMLGSSRVFWQSEHLVLLAYYGEIIFTVVTHVLKAFYGEIIF